MTVGKVPMDKAECEQQELSGTLPKLLLRNCLRYGDSRVALREKDRGIWISYTWKKYFDIVSALALAFREEGLKKGDKVAIIGENKPHVYWFELAALSCGAVVFGIFSDCSSEEVKYFLDHSDATFVVCQDQEQVDKMLVIKDKIPKVKKVIYWEEKGLWSNRDPLLLTTKDMLRSGEELLLHHKGDVEEMILSTNPEDLATLLYSSGTTGLSKAAMHTHRNIIRMAEVLYLRNPIPETTESVSFLPIAWIAEQLLNVSYSLVRAFTINFPEKQETVQEDIRAIGPHVIVLTPRVWEEFIGTIRMKITDAFWFNRVCYEAALRVGSMAIDARKRGVSLGVPLRVLRAIADFCVFRPLRDRLGFSRIHLAYTASTAVSPDVIDYFHMIGIPLVQFYGSSECGVATMHQKDRVRPETCGTALDGYEITISDSGEVLVRCDSMFKGYYKNPEKTASALDGDTYHTGDFGRLDADGHLIVMDRLDDLQKIGAGRVFSPQFAEVRLRFSAYIKDALIVGRDGGESAVALINVDFKNASLWAEKRRIAYTTFVDLSQKKEVRDLIRSEISKVNAYLPEYARIGRFLNLHKEFDPDDAEITRTRKVRRDFMERKYQELIDALFEGKDQIEIAATIEYQDGSKGNIRSTVFLEDTQGGAPR